MAEPTLAPASPQSETVVYRPISLLAVLGLVCAGIFAAIAVVNALAGLLQGTPAFLSPWFLALPAVGGILCLLAMRRIKLAEGTMTGDRLAKWGLWLSIVGGLGYYAYEFGVSMAIQQSAHSFLAVIDKNAPNDSGVFEHIQKGELNRAFLLTQSASVRSGVDPDDPLKMFRFDLPEEKNPKSPLDAFKDSEIVYLLRSTDNAPVPLGVRDWGYQEGGFVIERTYQLDTPEMQAEFLIKVRSTESKEAGVERKWQVLVPIQRLATTRYTTLGANVQELRIQCNRAFGARAGRVNSGKKVESETKDTTSWNDINVMEEHYREPLRQEIVRFFQGKGSQGVQIFSAAPALTPWERKEGHVEMTHPFLISVPLYPPETESREKKLLYAHGKAVLRSTNRVDPATEATAAGWDVISYEITKLRPSPKMPEVGSPGPPGM